MSAALILAGTLAGFQDEGLSARGGGIPAVEIVVTGERVSRTLHDTAASVATETAASSELRASPDRLEQLLEAMPNVQLGSGGEGPTIRGQDSNGVLRDLSAFLGGNRPRATLQIDGRAVNYNELAFGLTSIWDVEQVEVFRSPQTTTQGRNAIGGAIFVTTAAPEFSWGGRARAVVGQARTRQISGAVSGPLVEDQLALRLAGELRRSRTSSRLTSTAAGIDANRDDSDLVRFKLRAEPRALPGARLDLTFTHVNSQMPQIEGVRLPYEQRRDPNATYGIFKIDVDSLAATAAYAFSPALASRTTLTFGDAEVRRFAPAGLGETRIAGRDGSVETVLDFNPSKRVSAVAGMAWQTARLHQRIDLTRTAFNRGDFVDRQTSFGVFGEATWRLLPRLGLTAGLRHQHDRQHREGRLTGRGGVALDYDKGFTAWLPKVSLAYDASPDFRIGVLAQHAANPGGVTLNLFNVAQTEFRAETLWDYEAFVRATLLSGRLELSANLFRYAIRNAQRPQTRQIVTSGGAVYFSEISNAPRARSQGLEAQARWRASPRFSLDAALGLLDTRVTRTLLTSDPLLGKEFQRSPHLSASASAEWRPRNSIQLSAQLRHNTGYFSDDAETAALRVGRSTTVDARAAWITGRFTVFGYARNAFDEFHLTYLFGPAPPPPDLATAGDPRELGLGIEARF